MQYFYKLGKNFLLSVNSARSHQRNFLSIPLLDKRCYQVIKSFLDRLSLYSFIFVLVQHDMMVMWKDKDFIDDKTCGTIEVLLHILDAFSIFSVSNLLRLLKTVTMIEWNDVLLNTYFKSMYKYSVQNIIFS